MKSLYAWIILLLMGGLSLTFFLIPSNDELAFIQLKGEKYTDAELHYKKQYEKGVRTPDVIRAMESLNLKEGNAAAAIDLMREYIEEHPDDIHSLQLLADLYKLNLQYDRYQETLLKINQQKTTKEILKEVASGQRVANQQTAYCATLQKMADYDYADEIDLLDLAYCHAEHQEYAKAQHILEQRRKKYPSHIIYGEFLFELWVTHENTKLFPDNREQEKKTIDQLIDFLGKKKDPKSVNETIEFFSSKLPEWTPYLISQLDFLIKKEPFLEATVLQTLYTYPKYRKHVFEELLQLHKRGRLNPELQNLLFKEAVANKDEMLISILIQTTNVAHLLPSTLFEITYYAISQHKIDLTEQLSRAYGVPYLENHPVIDAMLALNLNQDIGLQKISKLLEKNRLTQTEMYYFFKLAAITNDPSMAFKIGEKLFPYSGLSENQLFEMAYTYVQLGKAQHFFDRLQKVFPAGLIPDSQSKAAPAFALLNASLKRSFRTLEWLEKNMVIPEYMLKGIYDIAIENREEGLALAVAAKLKKNYPSNLSTALFLYALVRTGDFQQGIPALDTLYVEQPDPSIEDLYFQALVFAAKKEGAYKSQLHTFMLTMERRGGLPVEKQKEYAYLYLDLLQDISRAQRFFKQLAEQKKLLSSEIDTYLYLLGPHFNNDTKKWIVDRAIHSTNREEWAFWLEKLVYGGGFYEVVCLFEEKLRHTAPQEIAPKGYFAYLDALLYLKERGPLRFAVDLAFGNFHTADHMERLSLYATEAEYLDARRRIWEWLAATRPTDPLVWQQLASVIFDQREYCAAAEALLHFFRLHEIARSFNPKLYESLFQLGEIYEIKKCKRQSQKLYLLALSQIDSMPEKTIRMEEVESIIQYRLGAQYAGLYLQHELFEKTGWDPNFASSYANMLMDMGKLKWARHFLIP